MYVCICQAVTEKHIREAVEDGVTTFCDLNTKLGIASACGTCESFARDLLQQTLGDDAPCVPPGPRVYSPTAASLST